VAENLGGGVGGEAGGMIRRHSTAASPLSGLTSMVATASQCRVRLRVCWWGH
jgi:hypothetical protein